MRFSLSMPAPRPLAVCSAVLLAAFSALSLNAQTVTTPPVGAMVYSFPATAASPSSTTTFLSIPLKNSSVYSGSVSGVSANTISFSGSPFTSGELAQAGSPFFVRIASGAQAGRIMLVTSNTASSVVVDTSDNSSQTTDLTFAGWAVQTGDKVDIIVGDTIADIFGDGSSGNPLVLTGAPFSFQADAIGIYNRSTARFDAYHFNTTNGFWRPSLSAVNSNNLIIYPNQPVQIVRRANRAATSITVTGEVPTVPTLVKTTGNGVAVYASTGYPVSMTLSQMEIPNFIEGTFSFLSDAIGLYNPSTAKFDSYYRRSDVAENDWRFSLNAIADQSFRVVDHSGIVLIVKRGAVSGPTSFIKLPMPYSL